MKTTLSIGFYLIISMLTFGQGIKQTTMEIGRKSITDSAFVIEWLKRDFIADDSTSMDKTKTFFPFFLEGTNKQLGARPELFTFYGLPIENAYANYRDGHKFGLFFLLHIAELGKLAQLAFQIGEPENGITKQDIETDTYDIIIWTIGDNYITLRRSHLSRENEQIPLPKRNAIYCLSITNAEYGELPGPDPVSL